MKCFFIILLFLPLGILAQQGNVLKLTSGAELNSKESKGWIPLDSGWRFKAGDNPGWASPDFNDSSWQSIRLFKDLNSLPETSKKGILWFRLRIIADSTESQPLVMRIYQSGASEVYLDGKLIHRLGIVSANADSSEYYDPARRNLSFPLSVNKEQLLSIRFLNLPAKYPIYSSLKSYLSPWVTKVDNAEDDYVVRYNKIFTGRLNIVMGVATILCILYLSFFLFFSTQKINLYFSLCNLFFLLFLIFQSLDLNYHGTHFKFAIPAMICTDLYILLLLYCTYKMFNQRIGWMYRFLLVIGILSIPTVFFIEAGIVMPFMGVLLLIDILRISIRSLQNERTGARIILFFMTINLVYWVLNLLSGLSVISIPDIDTYVPFAFLIGPLSLAIYLGYTFGKTSQSLRQKLVEVEQLSIDKQQILSNQNETLEKQVKERTSALNESLENLKSTQAQLIQSEKMASLGELTAGIAHEIQNPLNFVNNFSEVSIELMNEMVEEVDKGNTGEVKSIANDLVQNLEKINHHGKRADIIVKGMLQHSRSSSGQKELTDINALADEYLRLAYHGLRAKEKSFNATLKTNFDEATGNINIIPQDIGRVILNLIINAFYVVDEKKKAGMENYDPTVSVSTKRINDKVEIRINDNGNGIPQKIRDKIFQPFFTTKPTGQGTGLGLSLSYDIVKAHGGELRVETKEGEGTTFIMQLPIN